MYNAVRYILQSVNIPNASASGTPTKNSCKSDLSDNLGLMALQIQLLRHVLSLGRVRIQNTRLWTLTHRCVLSFGLSPQLSTVQTLNLPVVQL